MGLIDENKKKKFYDDQRLTAKGMSLAMESIEFAETELQNLAIEFAEWKELNVVKTMNRTVDVYYTMKGISEMYFYNYQLFTKFIEQRKTN